MDSYDLKNLEELTLEQEQEVEDLVIKIMDLFDNQNLVVCFQTLYICCEMLEKAEKEMFTEDI